MLDLITGHKGTNHIMPSQIAKVNIGSMLGQGENAIIRLYGGSLSYSGLVVTIENGIWRANGYDLELENESITFEATSAGVSRIDDVYMLITENISTGIQNAEIIVASGIAAANPTNPPIPTYMSETETVVAMLKAASVTVNNTAISGIEDFTTEIVESERVANLIAEMAVNNTRITNLENKYSFKHYNQITDWNDATRAGWYSANNANNAPIIGWCSGIVIPMSGSANSAYQIVGTNTNNGMLYIRQKNGSSWGGWYELNSNNLVRGSAWAAGYIGPDGAIMSQDATQKERYTSNYIAIPENTPSFRLRINLVNASNVVGWCAIAFYDANNNIVSRPANQSTLLQGITTEYQFFKPNSNCKKMRVSVRCYGGAYVQLFAETLFNGGGSAVY